MALAQAVVAGIFAEDGSEDGFGEEILRCGAYEGCAEALTESATIGTVVGAPVEELLVPCGRDPADNGERGETAAQAEQDFIAAVEAGGGLAGIDDFLGVGGFGAGRVRTGNAL